MTFFKYNFFRQVVIACDGVLPMYLGVTALGGSPCKKLSQFKHPKADKGIGSGVTTSSADLASRGLHPRGEQTQFYMWDNFC